MVVYSIVMCIACVHKNEKLDVKKKPETSMPHKSIVVHGNLMVLGFQFKI
jgi:hypothetical protein